MSQVGEEEAYQDDEYTVIKQSHLNTGAVAFAELANEWTKQYECMSGHTLTLLP
jgi:hypothetical protein